MNIVTRCEKSSGSSADVFLVGVGGVTGIAAFLHDKTLFVDESEGQQQRASPATGSSSSVIAAGPGYGKAPKPLSAGLQDLSPSSDLLSPLLAGEVV